MRPDLMSSAQTLASFSVMPRSSRIILMASIFLPLDTKSLARASVHGSGSRARALLECGGADDTGGRIQPQTLFKPASTASAEITPTTAGQNSENIFSTHLRFGSRIGQSDVANALKMSKTDAGPIAGG